MNKFYKNAYCFDFDDTLVKTKAKIYITKDNKIIKSLTSDQFANYKLNPKEKVDSSDFRDPRIISAASKYKMWSELKRVYNNKKMGRNDDDIYVITARGPLSKTPIHNFLKKEGINIPLNHIITVGTDKEIKNKYNTPQKKLKVLKNIKKKYNHIFFFDDNPDNIKILTKLPGISSRLVEKNKINNMRAKLVNEDSMGGVSAPMSTMANTPGMGNAVPASTAAMSGAQQSSGSSIGSGDMWGDGPIYDQNGKLTSTKKKKRVYKKRKKKRKKKSVKESNINPYDKIGIMMAKKMGIKPVFKKLDSKTNTIRQKNFNIFKNIDESVSSIDDSRTKKILKQLNIPYNYKSINDSTYKIYLMDNLENIINILKKDDWELKNTVSNIKKFVKDDLSLYIYDYDKLPYAIIKKDKDEDKISEGIILDRLVSNSIDPYIKK